MMDILGILQWAIPSGGIGAAIAWVANRKVAGVRAQKEIHDTFKSMYDDVSALQLKTQKKYEETIKKIEDLTAENARTRRALNRLSRAIEAIQICPHSATCPVRGELRMDGDRADDPDVADGLQDAARGDGKHRDTGQRLETDGGNDDRHGGGHGDHGDTSGLPDGTAPGGGVHGEKRPHSSDGSMGPGAPPGKGYGHDRQRTEQH
jgi:hypothetical protein